MADPKLTPVQAERLEQIQAFQKSLAHIRKLVGELESSRAARPQVLQEISSQVARELQRFRMRAVGANIGTIADVAGQLSIVANRSAGVLMKIRSLNEGLANLAFQLDRAVTIAMASTPAPESESPQA